MGGVQGSSKAATHKGSERASLILACAKDILVESGFAGLSYRAIAKQAHITVGNVSYYFATKEDLMVALADFIFDRWEERFHRHVPASLTGRREIFTYSVRYMIEENKRAKSQSLLMEMWAMSNHSSAVARMMDVFYAKMCDWIESMLAGVNPGLSERERHLRAGLITAQIEGLMVLVGPHRRPQERLAGIEDFASAQIERIAFAA